MPRLRHVVALTLLAAGMLPGSASAEVGPPACWDTDVYARPDLARASLVYCQRVDDASLLTPPAHGRLTYATLSGSAVRFTYRADADAPDTDGFDLRLSGPSGIADLHFTVHVTPLGVNTPPVCPPSAITQRSDGVTPPTLGFQVMCSDAEHDPFTITAAGPGTFLNAPLPFDPISTTWLQYRPATTAGTEHATYTGTDDLGAASAPAGIDYTFGPAVDRPPSCVPNPALYPDLQVYTRPGRPRRFPLICTDPDGDPLSVALRTPPGHGRITAFIVGDPTSGWWGNERWIDVTYVPDSDREGEDPFTVQAVGPRGLGPESRIVLRSEALPSDHGGGCGYSPSTSIGGATVALTARCDDDDGDPITGTIVDAPQHGTATAPTATPTTFGGWLLSTDYTPNAGYVGADYVGMAVGDDIGDDAMRLELQADSRATATPSWPHTIYITPPTTSPSPVAPAASRRPGPGARR